MKLRWALTVIAKEREGMIKGILYIVGFFALIGILVVTGCFKVVF